MPIHLLSLLIGFFADLAFGDPRWMPHPVVGIGKLISFLERPLKKVFPKTSSGQKFAGLALVVIVVLLPTLITVLILWACSFISVWLRLFVEAFMCYQLLAAKSMRKESMKVYKALCDNDLKEARGALSMIVGRDTDKLDIDEIICATVETIAENTNDAVTAPMIFMAIGGAPLGILYKAVNTMDSMVGYKNDKFKDYGMCAAKLDDILNFVPARISGFLMAFCARFVGLDSKCAMKIFKRDRLNHISPNSAHTEAACAGALHIQLGGVHSYFGKTVEKPTIGDADRPVNLKDIVLANKLMYVTSVACLLVCLVVCDFIFFLFALSGLTRWPQILLDGFGIFG